MKLRTIKSESVREEIDRMDTAPSGIHRIKDSVALLYHENSKFDELIARREGIKIGAFSNPYVNARAVQPYKAYPGKKTISLNPYRELPSPQADFFTTLRKRSSTRTFVKYSISLNELFRILTYAYGITRSGNVTNIEGHQSYRTVPSPGALFPLEIYIVLFSSDINEGLYHFRPDINALECLKEGSFKKSFTRISGAENFIDMEFPCGFVIVTSVYERVFIKYGERGYRWLLQEVGFVNQNLALIFEALGLGSCMLGGFLDDKVNEFIEIDHPGESVQSVTVFGKKE
ncbi:MAG: SagB/ThcOx family dehydrogenase [Bacteroidota bacterium]